MEDKNWSFFDPNLAEKDPSVLIPELRSSGARVRGDKRPLRRGASMSDLDDSLDSLEEQEVPARRSRYARR